MNLASRRNSRQAPRDNWGLSPNYQVVAALVPRLPSVHEKIASRPRIASTDRLPDFLGLATAERDPFPRAIGRDLQIASAVARLQGAHALCFRGLPGGGVTSFANSVVAHSAVEGGRVGLATSLRNVRWDSASSAANVYQAHLARFVRDVADRGRTVIDALETQPCTVLVDDLEFAEFLPPRELAGLCASFAALAQRPNVEVAVTLRESRNAEQLKRLLGFDEYVVRGLSPLDVWKVFEHIAARYGVVFDSSVIANFAFMATTPREMMAMIRSTAAVATAKRQRSNLVDAKLSVKGQTETRYDPLELYDSLDPHLLAALLLESPYRGGTPEEEAVLERWSAYGLATAMDRAGYGLSLNLFSEALANVISPDLWRQAREASKQDKALGREVLVRGIDQARAPDRATLF